MVEADVGRQPVDAEHVEAATSGRDGRRVVDAVGGVEREAVAAELRPFLPVGRPVVRPGGAERCGVVERYLHGLVGSVRSTTLVLARYHALTISWLPSVVGTGRPMCAEQ